MSSPWLIQVPVAKSSPKILSKLRLPWFSVLFFPFLLTSISSSFQPINYNCLYHLAIHSCFFNSAPLSSVSVQGELRKEVGTLTLLEGDPGVRTSGRWGRGEGRKVTHAYNVVSFFNSHHTKKFSYIIYSEWAT